MKPRQSADLLLTKRVFDSSPDFISVVDLQYRYQRVNPAYAQAFGIDQDEIAGLLAQDLFGKEIFENTLKPKFDRCAAGHEVEYESWFTFPNLGKRYLSVSYFPLLTEGSVIEGVIVMARDETERKVAQDEVKKSENQYRDLFDSAPLAYFATSFDGRIQMVNESAVKLLGYSREELIGESMLGLYAKTTYGREKAIQLQQQVQSGIGLTGEELQMLRKGGDTVWVSLTVRLIYDQNEQIVEHHGIVQDISEQKAREDELIKEQQRLQLINEIMAQINTGVTTDAIIKQTIEKLSVLFPIYRIAYSTISKNGEMEVLHSKEPKWLSSINGLNVDLNIASDYLLALRTRQSVCISDITKNPLVAPLADQLLSIHIHAICKNPLIHSGKIQGVLCLGASEPHDWSVFEKSTLREVAELVALTIHNTQVEKDRREAEVALATNRQRLSMALEATGSGTWDWNLQTGHVVSEDAWFRTLGYEQHQTVPHVRFWKTLVHPDDMRHVRNALKRHFSGETETYECINRLRKSNGKWRWSLDRGRVIEWSAEGKALRMVGTNTDITELRVLQEKLQESEARFQSILDHSPSLIYMKDRDGRYLLVNKKCEEMFGVTNEEIQGKMSHEVFPQKLADQFFRNDRLIMESRSPHLCEEHISQADGEHTVLSMQFPILDSTGKLNALCGISTDITARRLIEEALRKSEDRFEKYFESGLVGMAITSLNKGWIEVNERMCEILGFSRQELNEWTWAELTHPDDLAADEAKFTKLLAGGIESYSVEKRFVRKNGGAVHTNLYVNAVRNDVGTVEYVMAMIEDITGRKQAEQNLLEAQKALQNQNEALEQEVQRRSARIQELEQRRMQVEKLAALAQVAAGVAHEINNPLASISQAMLLVKQAVDPAHPYFEYVGRIDECIARMARIVQHMYELYRPQQSTLLEQNVVPIVSTAIDIMQPAAEKRLISLDAWLPDRIMTVLCVPTELVQIVCNLIQNALEASAPEQHVIVNITNDQKHVIVSISDKGSGISSDMFSHIFEPFFTTKGTEGGQGLGLGLSVSKSLVESMGGMLRFTSNKNQGSTFNIVLPVLTRKGKESI